ncbi:energy transducer TonB [Aquitalea sp. LB_tupeE]|uniref:energy transducer TonB n=1 Tax=Aquitalea sp. LB_tupeE TaxID=2748078 RepID=UPI0015C08592|nr:energy transducer TonB [Aquitalea sp. LB_tupeE]NWK77256.1 energy transducer TonB [Aquitalea sp. LB_tupeE]
MPVTFLPRSRLSTALLLSGLLHGTLLFGLAPALLHTPPPLPAALPLQLQAAPAPTATKARTRAAASQSPLHSTSHSAHATMTAPANTQVQPVADSSPHPAATANPAATVSTAPGSTMTNTGEGSNAKPANSGASVHQPALYRSAYLHNPEPPYPERSRELGEQGRVILQVRVSAEGRALQVEVTGSSRSRRLDEAARQAVADWRFIPAKQDGVALESSLQVPITFSLQAP